MLVSTYETDDTSEMKYKDLTLDKIFELIKNGGNETWQKHFANLRQLHKDNDKSGAELLERSTYCFTPSGVFNERKSESLISYSRLIVLDFDDVTDNELTTLAKLAKANKFTRLCYVSASGHGYRVVVEIDSDLSNHKQALNELDAYYRELTGIGISNLDSDVTHSCLFSHDVNAYYNPYSEVFAIIKDVMNYDNLQERYAQICDNIPEVQDDTLDTNIRLNKLCKGCKEGEISLEDARMLIQQSFSKVEPSEIDDSLKDVYGEDIIVTKIPNITSIPNLPVIKDYNIELEENPSPMLPESVYTGLPDIVSIYTNKVEGRKRDMLFLSMIVTLGSCIADKCYMKDKVGKRQPNLYLLMIAPPASSKGIAMIPKGLVQNLEHKDNPIFRMTLGADSSSAGFMKQLKSNKGLGLIIDSEADTLANSGEQTWGLSNSDLRKGYHNETIEVLRRDEIITIDKPSFSLVLTGTNSQLKHLVQSTENGLSSRFLMYLFHLDEPIWEDRFVEGSEETYEEITEKMRGSVQAMFDYLQTLEKGYEVKFTDTQRAEFNSRFSQIQRNALQISEEAVSIVNRIAVALSKISIILTILDVFDTGELPADGSVIMCSDENFVRATNIIETLLTHSLVAIKGLKNGYNSDSQHLSKIQKRFYEALPSEEFTLKDAKEVAEKAKLGISDGTVFNYLKKMVNRGLLVQEGSNRPYKKVG